MKSNVSLSLFIIIIILSLIIPTAGYSPSVVCVLLYDPVLLVHLPCNWALDASLVTNQSTPFAPPVTSLPSKATPMCPAQLMSD